MRTFEEAVLAVLADLPPGEVMTYGEVAEAAGWPGAARAVGNLLARSGEEVPWWRVVGAGGRIRSPEAAVQANLLESEGLEVAAGRVLLWPRT